MKTNRLISEIQQRIKDESSINMTPEQEAYVVGLADALEIAQRNEAAKPKIGRKYFVIQYDKRNRSASVCGMTLHKITETKNGMNYCFAKPPPDSGEVVLHTDLGIKSRVFDTQEDAMNGIASFLLSVRG